MAAAASGPAPRRDALAPVRMRQVAQLTCRGRVHIKKVRRPTTDGALSKWLTEVIVHGRRYTALSRPSGRSRRPRSNRCTGVRWRDLPPKRLDLAA
jgi:hypothetical protein